MAGGRVNVVSEMFFAGMILGALAGVTVTCTVGALRDASPLRRDRRNRLELPGDRVYRGRR